MRKKTFQTLKSLKRNYLILFILFTVLTFALIYNSCSPEGSKSVKFSKILNNLGPGFSVIINSGFYATKKKNVTLTFEAPEKNLRGEVVDYEMKVSRNSDCSDGEWEDYQPTKGWNLDNGRDKSNIEKKYFAYTKFREKRPENVNYVLRSGATGESDCVHDSIVYDKLPPRLELGNKPHPLTGQKNAFFTFTGKDFEGGGISFQCQIDKEEAPKHTCGDRSQESENSPWKPCPSLEYEKNLTLGKNTNTEKFRFSLKGTDAAGNCEILEYEWTIDQTIPSIELDCPKTNSNEKTGKIKATLGALDTSDTFSLRCKKNNQNNQFGDCNCENPCSAIKLSSPQPLIQETSFIKESKPGGYHKYSLSVKLKDITSGKLSDPETCVWYVDSEAPEVKLELLTNGSKKYNHDGAFKFIVSDNSDVEPNGSGVTVTLDYKVKDSSNKVLFNETSTCNTKSEGCEFKVQNIIFGTGNNPNEYTISVSATDPYRNTSENNFTFHAISGVTPKQFSEREITKSSGKADLLFVLDDSQSMSHKAMVLGDSFSGIIDSLSKLSDWQIAVTSMEKGHDKFGKLVQLIDDKNNTFLTNKYILSSQATCEAPLHCDSNKRNLELIFKRTITNGVTDNNFTFLGFNEHGIQSVNVLLDYYNNKGTTTLITGETSPPLNNNEIQAINSFFRTDSTFVVIFITDEKNCSIGSLPTDCHNGDITNPNHHQNLINKVQEILGNKGNNKKFITYPIIPIPGEGLLITPYVVKGSPPEGKTIHETIDGSRSIYIDEAYPKRIDDDYWKLAEATQGRKNDAINPVIWVDVYNEIETKSLTYYITEGGRSSPLFTRDVPARTPSSTSEDCTTASKTADGIYTKDLCAISKDILNVAQSAIGLSCNNPISDNQHKITYSYKEPGSSSFQDLQDPSRNTTNGHLEITINSTNIQVIEPQPGSLVNRILLKSLSEDKDIPHGTYRVDYFCPSIGIYALERDNALQALDDLKQPAQ